MSDNVQVTAETGRSDEDLVQELIAKARAEGIELVGENGLLRRLTKTTLENVLQAEMDEHLGYAKHERAAKTGGASVNARNGARAKTVTTDVGPVELEVPRDRDGSFTPQIVRKRQRRLNGVDSMVLSLSARGLTHGEICAHLAEVYGAQVSKQSISAITDSVIERMADWQNRPLDPVYPVLFVDAVHVKIRDGQVANRPIYVVLGVTVDGERDILGIWAGEGGEGAKYWAHVFTELRNRGVADVLMLVADGLKGISDAASRPRHADNHKKQLHHSLYRPSSSSSSAKRLPQCLLCLQHLLGMTEKAWMRTACATTFRSSVAAPRAWLPT